MKPGSAFLNNLGHNPQSSVPTQWSLLGTYHDETVGPYTSIRMLQVHNKWPLVRVYHYSKDVRTSPDCPWSTHFIGHEELHMKVTARTCTWKGGPAPSTFGPFERIQSAIRY